MPIAGTVCTTRTLIHSQVTSLKVWRRKQKCCCWLCSPAQPVASWIGFAEPSSSTTSPASQPLASPEPPLAPPSSSSPAPPASARKLLQCPIRAPAFAASVRRAFRWPRFRWPTGISGPRLRSSHPTCRSDRPRNTRRDRGPTEFPKSGRAAAPFVRVCCVHGVCAWFSSERSMSASRTQWMKSSGALKPKKPSPPKSCMRAQIMP